MSEKDKTLYDSMDLEEKKTIFVEKVQEDNFSAAAEISQHLSNQRIRDMILNLSPQKIAPFFRELGWTRTAQIVAWLPEEITVNIWDDLSSSEKKKLVSNLDSDELTDIIGHISPEKKEDLIDKIPSSIRKEVDELIEYDPSSAGGHMETEYIAVNLNITVDEALQKLRRARSQIKNTNYIYITNEKDKLLGVISAQELSFVDRSELVKNIMHTDLHVARSDEPVEEAARTMKYRRFNLLPVVNTSDQLLGVLTLDTAIDELSAELADDFVSISGTTGEESFFTRPREAIKMRLPWMAGNVFLNLGAVAIISSFEETIAQIAILAAFLPMITDMGGNVGIQALSVSIRSIALGEVQLGNIWQALRKEVIIGIFNGLALGVIFALLAYFLEGIPLLGIVAGIALATNVLVAGIVGGTLPFLIKKLGKDPAMMTGPFLTTITDITGVTIYLGLSTLFLLGVIV